MKRLFVRSLLPFIFSNWNGHLKKWKVFFLYLLYENKIRFRFAELYIKRFVLCVNEICDACFFFQVSWIKLTQPLHRAPGWNKIESTFINVNHSVITTRVDFLSVSQFLFFRLNYDKNEGMISTAWPGQWINQPAIISCYQLFQPIKMPI